MRVTRRAVPLLFVPLVLGAVAGCSDDPEPRPTPVVTSDAPPSADPRDKGGTGGGDADDGGTGLAPSGDLATCILGDWVSDNDAVLAATQDMLARMGMQGSARISGEAWTTFGPSTATSTYRDYVTEVTMISAGQTVTSIVRMDGTMTLTYTIAGDVITSTAASDLSGIEITSTVLIDGVELPGYSEGFDQGLGAASASGQTQRQQVTCSGDVLTAMSLDDGSNLVTTLTRR